MDLEAYEFNKSLVSIGANIAFSINDLPKGLTELDEFLFRTLPWEITEMEDLRWRLGITELGLAWCWHLGLSQGGSVCLDRKIREFSRENLLSFEEDEICSCNQFWWGFFFYIVDVMLMEFWWDLINSVALHLLICPCLKKKISK